MPRALLVLPLLAACAGDPSGDTAATGAGTAPGSTTTAPPCVELKEGPWAMNGSCFGMAMYGTLALKPDTCKFTFSDWNMAMSVPEGGEVVDHDVTLTGSGWDDCEGTTGAAGRTIEGVCGGGSCQFDMVFDG